MPLNSRGENLCLYCKSSIRLRREDTKFCTVRCRNKFKYINIYKKQKYCIVCKIKSIKKYCSRECNEIHKRLLIYDRKIYLIKQKIKNLRVKRGDWRKVNKRDNTTDVRIRG